MPNILPDEEVKPETASALRGGAEAKSDCGWSPCVLQVRAVCIPSLVARRCYCCYGMRRFAIYNFILSSGVVISRFIGRTLDVPRAIVLYYFAVIYESCVTR